MDLSTITLNVRQDLGDLDPAQYRWTDQIIQRQIDRALDKYSGVAPLLKINQIPTIPHSRLYAYPNGAWWIERVEYPIGQWPKQYHTWLERTSPPIFDPNPANPWLAGLPAVALSRGAGGPLSGTYQYAYTWVVPGGETKPSPVATIAVPAASTVVIANLPLGPYGVVATNIYRTASGGSQLQYLTSTGSNSVSVGGAGSPGTNSVVDTIQDAQLGSAAPLLNSTGGILQFEMQLERSRLPVDAGELIEVTAAYKHQLDNNSASVPEKHWDVISLGAEAFCLWEYVTNVNDNFDYVDGQFRDRVDDTKSPVAWRRQAEDAMSRFHARLTEIRNQVQDTTPLYPQWGDKPVRWDRI